MGICNLCLQAILKRSLKPTCSILPLMKRGHANNLEFFLSHIGKVYMHGSATLVFYFYLMPLITLSSYTYLSHMCCHCSVNVDSNKLYPAVQYPVQVGTPLISPLIQWDHSQSWDVPKVEDFPAGSGGSTSATVYNIGQ